MKIEEIISTPFQSMHNVIMCLYGYDMQGRIQDLKLGVALDLKLGVEMDWKKIESLGGGGGGGSILSIVFVVYIRIYTSQIRYRSNTPF